jgi:hypothetical protein
MIFIFFIISILTYSHITLANHQPKIYLYVAENGNDKNPGTKDKPFASLEKARQTVQKLLSNNSDSHIIVYIREGTYYLQKTVVFGVQDYPKGNNKITYKAYGKEKPVFSSGIKIKDWQKLSRLNNIPEKALGKVWVANVPESLGFVYSLYDEGQRLSMAKSDGFFPTKSAKKAIEFAYEECWQDFTTLHFPKGAIKNWQNLADAEILVRPKWPWVVNILKLESVDEESLTAKTNLPGTYGLYQLLFGTDKTESCWVLNMIEHLDEPEEWVYISKERKIYLWPKDDVPGNDIYAPSLKELIRLEGNDKDGIVKNIVLDGLTFTCGERDTWTEKDAGLQHDWEMYDKDNALVRLRNAENCIIKNCKFVNSSGTAVRLDLHCQNNKIISNEIGHIGGTGVLLAGYGPGQPNVNKNNEVSFNHIHHCGQIYWHNAGILIWQSGENCISNNLIHDLPYSGIVVTGARPEDFCKKNINLRRECTPTIDFNNVPSLEITGLGTNDDYRKFIPCLYSRKNRIEKNEIHNVVKKLDDGNAIYLSGAGMENIVNNNYIHHLTARGVMQAIRCDDYQVDVSICKNIIFHCVRAGIVIKGTNFIENNIIAGLLDKDVSIGQDIKLEGYILIRGHADGSRIQKNIIYHQGGKQEIYEEGKAFFAIPAGKLENCFVSHNIIYHTKTPKWSMEYLKKLQKTGVEKSSISADPKFINLTQENFDLSQSSPVWKLGFEKIDLDEIGLRKKISR